MEFQKFLEYDFWKNRSKLFRKRSAYRLKIMAGYYFKKSRKDPVFILTTRRTGSNMLVDCLNGVPEVSLKPEILNESMFYGLPGRFISKKAVFRHIVHSVYDCPRRIGGAKFLMVQMEKHRLSAADLKALFPSAKFLILYRRSIVEQFASLKIAETTGAWLWNDQFRLPESVHMDIAELQRFCGEIKYFYSKLFGEPWLKDCSRLISYEALTADTQKVFDEVIFPFLGLPRVSVSSRTRKQNIKPLEEIVANYDEIRPLLAGGIMNQNYSL